MPIRRASLLVLVASALLSACASTQTPPTKSPVVTEDIDRFWEAADAIEAVADSAEQVRLFQSLYIDQGTPGLEAMITRRGYTAAEYVEALRRYPRFWAAMRPRMEQADTYASEIAAGIEGFREIYPTLRPARLYFTVGALRTPGMTLDDIVFIGSELALADSDVPTDEFPESFSNLPGYFATNPSATLPFLNVHEYVHTQQGPFGEDLLAMALQEGVAEFVAALSTGQSPAPAIAYAFENEDSVREAFERDMFGSFASFWLWSNRPNEFGVRDLGYGVGYAIAERYHAQAEDKTQAIARLIELDYQDPGAVDTVADASGYFERPVSEMRAEAPRVVRVEGLGNGLNLAPGLRTLTIEFSRPMDPARRGFDYGPLGADHVLPITRVIGMSEDGRSLTVEVNLEPGQRHQMTITSGFITPEGVRLVPHLVEATTRASE
ncbi:MAG: hypothetical protein AAGI52_13920 [Bacteroidota bacterium]